MSMRVQHNPFYFYRRDLGGGPKYLGVLERVGEDDYSFTYTENPVILVGKPQLPYRGTPCTTKEVKYAILDTLAPPYGEPGFENLHRLWCEQAGVPVGTGQWDLLVAHYRYLSTVFHDRRCPLVAFNQNIEIYDKKVPV